MTKIYNEETAVKTAALLLEKQAVKLSPDKMFTWASGIKSPVYCDNRKLLSYPDARDFIKKSFAELVKSEFPDADVIAGVATGAIAAGVLAADILNKPFIYVRSSSKGHGLENKIEGVLNEGEKVVVIEDLVSTGMSSLKAVDAIRAYRNEVLGMCSVFTYGLKQAEENFRKKDCKLISLSNFSILAKYASEKGYITEESIETIDKWRLNF